MSVFLFKRLLTFLATLAVASVLVFSVLELLPGNVAQVMLGETATPEATAALEKKLGLDRPAPQRYARWITGLLQGRTANSFSYDTPTAELIAERLQVTLPLAALAMGLTTVLALALGIFAASRHNQIGDVGVMAASQLGIAIPNFWLAILLILAVVLAAFVVVFITLRTRFKALFYILGAGVLYGFVATLARVITRHGNRVGAMLYGCPANAEIPGVFGMLPPRASRLHVLELLQRMRAPQAKAKRAQQSGTALADLLQAAEATLKRRSLVFVVSDFISQPGWLPAMGRLARRHDVVAVRLWDPLEMNLPDVGLVTLEDAETGEQLFVDASDPGFRERYAALAEAQEAALLQSLSESGADVLELATDDDLLDTLMRFTDLRKQRARAKSPLRFPSMLRRAALMTEAAP